MQYQEASAVTAADEGLVPTESVMDIISSLSCKASAAQPSSSQQHLLTKWHDELDPHGRPLMAKQAVRSSTTTPVAADVPSTAADMPGNECNEAASGSEMPPLAEQSGRSSVGSCDGSATEAAEPTAAVAAPASQQGTPEDQQHEQQPQQQELCLSSAASATSVYAPPAVGQEASSSLYTAAAAEGTEPAYDRSVEQVEETELPEQPTLQAVTTEEQHHQQQEPENASQQDGADDGMVTAEQMQHEHTAATAYLQEVKGLLASRLQLQSELSSYVHGLASKLDEQGQQLVELPANYQLMVSCCHAVIAAACH